MATTLEESLNSHDIHMISSCISIASDAGIAPELVREAEAALEHIKKRLSAESALEASLSSNRMAMSRLYFQIKNQGKITLPNNLNLLMNTVGGMSLQNSLQTFKVLEKKSVVVVVGWLFCSILKS